MILVVFAGGCRSGKTPAPASSAAPHPPAPASSSVVSPTAKQEVHFKTADGQLLAGDLYLAGDHSAPAVVLVDRQGGDRSEFAPLVERLRRADKRYTVLAFDRRGVGDSPPPLHPGKLSADRLARQDIRAAIEEVLRESGGRARGVVLVGSSVGAALVAEVAFGEPKVTALALISPGETLEGDIYHAYAQVRNLPTFLAASKDDNVSSMAVGDLSRMAMAGTVKRYAGDYPSAKLLGGAHPELWKDLGSFLMGVFADKPQKRQSLYVAPALQRRAKEQHARKTLRAGGAGR